MDGQRECAREPESRPRFRRSSILVPSGWTPIYGQEGQSHSGWRCPNIAQTPDGELPRCSLSVPKRDIEAHTKKTRHKYLIAQRDEGDFPQHMRQDPER
jgi:hypothetical protein